MLNMDINDNIASIDGDLPPEQVASMMKVYKDIAADNLNDEDFIFGRNKTKKKNPHPDTIITDLLKS